MVKEIKKCYKGFTLAELLIVIAIIGVLVAISVPIFSSQLEKARDAASIAYVRSAYSEAAYYAIEYNGSETTGQDNLIKPKEGVEIWVNVVGYVSAVRIKVDIKSHKANEWSGLADNLPFTIESESTNKDYPGCDDGKYSTSYRTWYLLVNYYSINSGELQRVRLYH